MFKHIYQKIILASNSKHTMIGLITLSFLESCISPLSPLILLIPMSLTNPKRAWRYAFIATIAAVAGSIVGYLLGFYLIHTIEPYIVQWGYQSALNSAVEWYQSWGYFALLIASIFPIPFKLFAIGAGMMKLSFVPFILVVFVVRWLHFALIPLCIIFARDKLIRWQKKHTGFPIIDTERLILRAWEDEDLEYMAAINQDEKVMEYFPGLQDRAQTEKLLLHMKNQQEERGFSWYAVVRKDNEKLIGAVGLNYTDFPADFTPAVEIGWRLGAENWQQGYATEAARAVLEHAFNNLNLPEVVSFTVVDNKPSRRVMEKIGLIRNPSDDFDHPKIPYGSPLKRHVLYRLTKAEFDLQHNVHKTYDKIANWFDSARSRTLMEQQYLDIILKNLPKNAEILDLGCGMGEPIAQYFIKHGFQVTGIDGSEKLIELAKKRYPSCEWIIGDMRELNLNKKFDCILAWHSLFHLTKEKQRAMFEIIAKHAKPGCLFAFTSGREESDAHWSNNGGEKLFHASLSEAEYRKELADNNFELIEYHKEDPNCGDATVWLTKKYRKHSPNAVNLRWSPSTNPSEKVSPPWFSNTSSIKTSIWNNFNFCSFRYSLKNIKYFLKLTFINQVLSKFMPSRTK